MNNANNLDDLRWPPKAGDKIRHFTQHGDSGGWPKHVHALVHVVAVFEHDGEVLATVAEWIPSRGRWLYETIHRWLQDEPGYWPDGSQPPPNHACDACKESR